MNNDERNTQILIANELVKIVATCIHLQNPALELQREILGYAYSLIDACKEPNPIVAAFAKLNK